MSERERAARDKTSIPRAAASDAGERSRRQQRGRATEQAIVPEAVSEAVRGPGQPLSDTALTYFESRFGHDFGRVRVHADARAANSARAIDAVAYTVGDDIAIDPGHEAMRTSAAPAILAHELTHVVQQSHTTPALQTRRLDEADGAAEHEAARAATQVARGGQVGPIGARPSVGVVQRALSDILAGGAVGAIAGAAIGALFGPIGALIGAGVGLLGGLAAGEVAGAERRGLTNDERREATKVFGASLDMSKVRIAESSVMSVGNFARTPFDTIYFPPGTSRLAFADFMPWLIHELAHVWQYQHGISVTEKLWWALHGQTAYDYGGEAGLRAAALQNKRFLDFNTEQQASIAADYYKALIAGRATSAYDPFIAQLKAGGAVRGTTSAPAAPAGGASGGGP